MTNPHLLTYDAGVNLTHSHLTGDFAMEMSLQLTLPELPQAVETPRSEHPARATAKRPSVGVMAPWVRMVREGGFPTDGAPLRAPGAVWKLLQPTLEALEVEQFWVLIMDAQHCVTSAQMITQGLLNSSLVHPREVFRAAIALNAAAIILAHNHPSGDPSPSADDRALTAQLVAAGRLLDIPVADHVVVGHGRYISFSESGLL